MHYFSIHNQAGEHLGFFIMLPDDENAHPQSGRFIVKLQSETKPQDQAALRVLEEFGDLTQPFCWRVEKDRINLYKESEKIGSLRNEFLRIGTQSLILGDMTGMM
ncbi:HLGFF motif protein [Neisseria wadsworthii]|uniref:Uncharacterized protein n=1 Tax=Neisseria wadsworthii 9715 TaxID=1030841 RepID=G4CRN3_9NEIS|nr:hypothetical protein [Neisseria wadsworthii]EGZ45184.1 hypothetical protein HMPREF9370_1743 [Neisseria wadsworthii 9715]QMT35426.1 hypothetical protein H3L96_10355 [Neisseria wadsworthii]